MNCVYSSSLALGTSLLGVLALGTLGTVPVQAASFNSRFDQIVVFGDSLSDSGNIFKITSSLTEIPVPENPLSFEGRFSNGLVWTEYFAPKFGLNLTPFTSPVQSSDGTNFAIGGATSGDLNVVNILRPDIEETLPGFTQQLTSFISPLLTNNQSANPNALYVLFAGANDYGFGGVTDPTIPVTNLSNAVQSLYGVGARNFLLLNLPGLGDTPLGLGLGLQDPLNQLTAAHNFILSSAVDGLSQSLPGINIGLVDLNTTFTQMLLNPAAFGLTNVTDSWSRAVEACLLVACEELPNPNEYLFWDDVHPTTQVHKMIAHTAYSTVQSQFPRVPEPTSIVALSVLGLGFLWSQKSSSSRKP